MQDGEVIACDYVILCLGSSYSTPIKGVQDKLSDTETRRKEFETVRLRNWRPATSL